MLYTFRPISEWPGAFTKNRKNNPFSASYNDTLRRLAYELDHLDARDIVVELAIEEANLRIDGTLRANTNPAHPGVILSFGSRFGPLRYATDVFDNLYVSVGNYRDGWKANLRAITLGLEALRKVDRYGVTKRGEQYTGWKALGSGIAMGPASMSPEQGAAWLAQHASGSHRPTAQDLLADPKLAARLYRDLAKSLHPDQGGDEEEFKNLQAAKAALDAL